MKMRWFIGLICAFAISATSAQASTVTLDVSGDLGGPLSGFITVDAVTGAIVSSNIIVPGFFAFDTFVIGAGDVSFGNLSGNTILVVGSELNTPADLDGLTTIGQLLPSAIDVFFDLTFTPAAAAVPLPAALPLFATGLAALGLLARRRKKQAA
jgi:hypothetical protein